MARKSDYDGICPGCGYWKDLAARTGLCFSCGVPDVKINAIGMTFRARADGNKPGRREKKYGKQPRDYTKTVTRINLRRREQRRFRSPDC